MKAVKPRKLGLLSRVFEASGDYHLAVSILAFFPIRSPSAGGPRTLLPDTDLWKFAMEQIGKEAVLDLGMPKPCGEVLVAGSAFAPGGTPRPACAVKLKMGSIDKTLYVVGDRTWGKGGASDPTPFTSMPITWANAFGGPSFATNPLGKGMSPVKKDDGEVLPLPNVEDPKHLVSSPRDRPAPAGLGPYDFSWPQRSGKLGTYDTRWLKEDFPGFARDIDLGAFSAAPVDQQITGFFRGDEAFSIENMHPDKPVLEGALPGFQTRCFVNQSTPAGEAFREIPMRLDTVWLFPNAERGVLVFRGRQTVAEDDAWDVLQILLACEELGKPRATDHYRDALLRRLDRKKGPVLREDDLMPPLAPGEAAPPAEPVWDLDELSRHEGLIQKNMRRKMELHRESIRQELVAQGMDPDKHMPPAPAEPREVKADDVDVVVEEVDTLLADEGAKAKAKMELMEAEARASCAERGIDFDEAVENAKKSAGGPPKFSADAELDKLREQAQLAHNAGVPLPAVEDALADPHTERDLRTMETGLKDMYRAFAQHLPPAAKLEGEARDRVRDEVARAAAAGESLAERDLTGADLSKLALANVDLKKAFLEHADLREADLTGADLTGAVLTRADLRGAKLEKARLAGANLAEAKLAGAMISGVDLSGAILVKADLEGADLAGAALGPADLTEATLDKANLERASLGGARFDKTRLAGARFAGADLGRATFSEASVAGLDFTGARLASATFYGASADGAVLRGCDLTKLRLVKKCSFRGADFSGANMERANLRDADLCGADFTGAKLSNADLSGSDLEGAKLVKAVAKEAMFVRANLSRADLSGANLMHAILQKAKVAGASFRGANLFRSDLLRLRVDGATDMRDALLTQARYVEEKRAR